MKNFFDCKDEKTTEKAFSQSLLISVLSILMCIVLLCSMTYAWFSDGVSSGGSTLKSGSFDVTVSITKTDGGVATADATVLFKDGKYTLADAGTYTVTLTTTGETTAKGYCVVTINGSRVDRTDVIVNDRAVNEDYPTKTDPFTFTIVTHQADTVVEIEAHWGVPAEPSITATAPQIDVGTAPSGEEPA